MSYKPTVTFVSALFVSSVVIRHNNWHVFLFTEAHHMLSSYKKHTVLQVQVCVLKYTYTAELDISRRNKSKNNNLICI